MTATIRAIVTSGNRVDGRLSFSGSRAGKAYSAFRLRQMSEEFTIAQVNIALPREPLDSAALAEFVANLEPVNALADSAPGFVWRLTDESGDATSIRAFADDRLIINMSVWESIEALWSFVYDGGHLEVMRRRREWMIKLAESHQA